MRLRRGQKQEEEEEAKGKGAEGGRGGMRLRRSSLDNADECGVSSEARTYSVEQLLQACSPPCFLTPRAIQWCLVFTPFLAVDVVFVVVLIVVAAA